MGWTYGDYDFLCSRIPSLAVCNLFARQLLENGSSEDSVFGNGLNRTTAGVGVVPTCAILSAHASGSSGNVANMVVCGVSAVIALFLAWRAARRVAAVGKSEFALLNGLYGLACILQLLTAGAIINQASTALVWLTALHAGLVAALFWVLFWLSFLTLQYVEDGRVRSFALLLVPAIVLFVGTTYIACDTAFQVADYFRTSPERLHSAWLFTLTTLWPAVAIVLFLIINVFVTIRVLREKRPILLFAATLAVFALAEAARYALSHRICSGTNGKIDGSFLATLLETASLGLLMLAWRSITESEWDETASSAMLS